MIQAFSSYSLAAASARVRLADWFAYLGVQATHHTFAGRADNRPSTLLATLPASLRAHHRLRRIRVAGQTVIVSRSVSPLSRGAVETRLLRDSNLGVYDFDDAIYLHAGSGTNPSLRDSVCRRACAAAEVVIVGNAYLADWASTYNKDVRVIPSCVDPGRYRSADHFRRLHDPLRLIWIGSRPTERYLIPILPTLDRLSRQVRIRLTVVSTPRPNPEIDHRFAFVDRVAWRPDEVADRLAAADVGLAPLTDGPYSRGKCAYKLLQYGASGLLSVGSPIGANASALDRLKGWSVHHEDDWMECILDVISESSDRRAARRAAARSGVQEHYSFQAWESSWRAAVGLQDGPTSTPKPDGPTP